MEARVIFSKKTKDKLQKGITVREKGRVLFTRLEELDRDGMLSKAESRADVARLVGYPRERAKAGYAWVSNLIRRGHITEIIRGHSPSGVPKCEYHLASTRPDYGYEEQDRHRARKKALAKMAEEATRQGLVEQMPVLDSLAAQTRVIATKVEITKGDIRIKLELCDNDQVMALIKQLLKGDK